MRDGPGVAAARRRPAARHDRVIGSYPLSGRTGRAGARRNRRAWRRGAARLDDEAGVRADVAPTRTRPLTARHGGRSAMVTSVVVGPARWSRSSGSATGRIHRFFQPRRPDHASPARARLGLPQRQPRRLRLGRLRHMACRSAPTGRPTTTSPATTPSRPTRSSSRRTTTRTSPAASGTSPTPTAAATTPRAARRRARPRCPCIRTTRHSAPGNSARCRRFNGRVEAPAINPGTSGLRP